MSNLQTVKEIYETFSRKHLDTKLSKLSKAVEWEYGGTSTDVP